MEAVNGVDEANNTSSSKNNNLVRDKQKSQENKRNLSSSRYRGRNSKDKHGKRGKEKEVDPEDKVANAEGSSTEVEEVIKEASHVAPEGEEAAQTNEISMETQSTHNLPPKKKTPRETPSPSTVKEVSEEVAEMNIKNSSVKSESIEPEVVDPNKKFTYDRMFLIEISKKDLSRKRPESLPNLEVVLSSTHKINVTKPFNVMDDFTPNFMQTSRNRVNMPFMPNNKQMGGGGRNSQQGRRVQKIIDVKLSSSSEVKLKTVENAWKPNSKKPQVEESSKDEPGSKLAELQKKMRGILNKLTPDNFDKLVVKVRAIPIESYFHLDALISLIFDKAVDEQGFSATYAQLCQVLSVMTVKDSKGSEKGKDARFRNLIINKCQKEFEKDNAKDDTLLEMKKEAETTTDRRKKEELTAIYNYEETKLRKRSVGNIRFIGELYILKMLTSPIMMRIIVGLLKKRDEESLECLCKLLTTIGQSLETSAATSKVAMDELNERFKTMNDIVNSKKTSSRVRFLLMDVLDLRTNRWVPRRAVAKPKTKAQVHEDIRKEEEIKQHQSLMASNLPNSRRNHNHHYNDNNSRERKKSHGAMADEGWNTVGTMSSTRRMPMDTSRLNLMSMRSIGNEGGHVDLRAGGGSNWSKGSSGGAGGAGNNHEESSNRFNVLLNNTMDNNQSYDNRRHMNPPRLAPGGNSRSVGSSYGSKSMPPPQSTEMQHALSAIKQFVAPNERHKLNSRSNSRESSRSREPEVVVPVAAVPLDYDEAKEATKKIIDHLSSSTNYSDAATSVNEVFSTHSLTAFVQHSLDDNIDKNVERRKLVGKFYQYLFARKKLPLDKFIDGTKESLEMVDDLMIDIPQIRDYYGHIFGFLLVDNAMTVEDLVKVLSSTDVKHRSFIFVSALRIAEKEMGPTLISDILKKPSFSWTNILPEGADVAQFITENKLSFTVEPTPLDPQQLRKQLLDLFKLSASDEKIFGWIEANVAEISSTFVRGLTTSLVESLMTVSDGGSLIVGEGFEDKLKAKVKLVHKYVDNNERLELPCLFGIQSLCVENEHPAGLMEQCCNAFYDQEVLSEESFQEWEKNQDPEELVGKGVCVTSVRKFLTWLQETEAEEAEGPTVVSQTTTIPTTTTSTTIDQVAEQSL